MFKGSYTALVTPFKDGNVDWNAFERLVEWQIKEGVNGIVPVGTTGESPTVDNDEHRRLIEVAVEVARKRVPVIAGTGSNSTRETIEMSEHARKVGADAALIVLPYYNKPTQEGLYLHFKALSEAVDLPILVYNVPSRVVIDMSVETLARVARLRNVVGVKDSTSNMARVTQQRLAIGEKFALLSGEDGTVLGFRAHGGHGCISVTSNVAPRLLAEFHAACDKDNWTKAREIHDRLMPLHDALFCETSPAPVKYAAWRLGIIGSPECRLPLAPVSALGRKTVDDALLRCGLLSAKAAE
jgi:4-hydroxy-tetrahydrodipicolinate synthase